MKTFKFDEITNADLQGAIATRQTGDLITVYYAGDEVPPVPDIPDPDAALRAQYEAEQQAKQAAEFAAYKARSGQPSYKAAAVKIAAEKLALTPLIDAALDALINADGDKSILVWWIETDQISQGDVNWQRIEAAVEWPKGVTADDLFALAATI